MLYSFLTSSKISGESYSYGPKNDNVSQKSLQSVTLQKGHRGVLDEMRGSGWRGREEVHRKKAGAQTATLTPPMTMKTCFTPELTIQLLTKKVNPKVNVSLKKLIYNISHRSQTPH